MNRSSFARVVSATVAWGWVSTASAADSTFFPDGQWCDHVWSSVRTLANKGIVVIVR